jgi:hypothetical protein
MCVCGCLFFSFLTVYFAQIKLGKEYFFFSPRGHTSSVRAAYFLFGLGIGTIYGLLTAGVSIYRTKCFQGLWRQLCCLAEWKKCWKYVGLIHWILERYSHFISVSVTGIWNTRTVIGFSSFLWNRILLFSTFFLYLSCLHCCRKDTNRGQFVSIWQGIEDRPTAEDFFQEAMHLTYLAE